MTAHIVLCGDSVFDNAAYTRGEPDVAAHLRTILNGAAQASLLAVDGATTRDVPKQLRKTPADASHLVISMGGNDALGHADLLRADVRSTYEALSLFADRVSRFQADYEAALEKGLALGLPTVVCTIYEGDLDPIEARVARVALMTFNDVVLRSAFRRGTAVIDLRSICTHSADYANPIEPSGEGGRKIAAAIARACGFASGRPPSQVYVGEATSR